MATMAGQGGRREFLPGCRRQTARFASSVSGEGPKIRRPAAHRSDPWSVFASLGAVKVSCGWQRNRPREG